MSRRYPQLLPLVPVKDDILPTAQRHVIEHQRTIDAIVNSVDPSDATFDNVLLPIANLENKQSGERAVISGLRYASPNVETQHAVEEAEKLWLDYANQVDERLDLFNLIKMVKDKSEPLDPESDWLLNRTCLRYRQCGHGILDDKGIQTWHDRNSKIEDLCAEFNRNVREYVPAEVVFTEDELAGVPEKELLNFPVDDNGKRRVGLTRNNAFILLRNAHNPETRKAMQLAFGQRMSKNAPIFRETILLRDENARMLGYRNHAEYRLPHRIAESVEWVESIIDSLTQSLLPESRKSYDQILAKKKEIMTKDGHDALELERMTLGTFEVSYYNRHLNEEQHIDHEKIMEYFPLNHTFPLILDLYASYFQLRYEKIDQENLMGHVWHDEVSVWAVWDDRPTKKGEFIGYLYTDMVERPNKYKGNQCVNLQPCYVGVDGQQVYPATTLMCNFSPSKIDNIVLLKHWQVKTIFHELGHCMHDLLSRHKFVKLHAFEGSVEFGEAVASMFERWSWMKDVLGRISCHYTQMNDAYMDDWVRDNPDLPIPPARIPDEVINPWLSERQKAMIDMCTTELAHASIDLAVHNPPSHEALMNMDENDVGSTIWETFEFARRPEPSYPYAAFTHLMSGYDAGYYAYVFARVFAADLFESTFANDPESKDAWDQFRTGIMEYGASRDQRKVLEVFLGRSPSTDAFLSSVGVGSVPAD